MAGFDAQVQQAISALKAGRREEARDLLLHVVDQDERNEQAWLYLSALVETLEEQEICLENVLALNPSNQKALKGLETIRRRISPPPTRRRDGPAQPPRPTAAPGADSNPYSDQPFDEWLNSAASPYGAAQPRTSDAPPTSVDWSRDSGPTVYGSGRNVPSPSPQEYDDWVQGLNLDEPATTTTPAGEPAASRPAPRPDMRRSGPFASRLPPTPPRIEDAAPPDWAAEFTAPPAPSAAPPGPPPFAHPFPEEDLFSGPAPTVAGELDPFAGEVAETVDVFEVAPGPLQPLATGGDWLGGVAGEQSAPALAPVPAEAAPARATAEDYYRYIPAEIEAAGRGSARRLGLTLLVIVLLIALNVVSYAYWLA